MSQGSTGPVMRGCELWVLVSVAVLGSEEALAQWLLVTESVDQVLLDVRLGTLGELAQLLFLVLRSCKYPRLRTSLWKRLVPTRRSLPKLLRSESCELPPLTRRHRPGYPYSLFEALHCTSAVVMDTPSCYLYRHGVLTTIRGRGGGTVSVVSRWLECLRDPPVSGSTGCIWRERTMFLVTV